LLFGAAVVARADDNKFDSLTLLPWSDTSISVSDKDHRAVIQYDQLFGDTWSLFGRVSAPLDEATRTAAFTSNNRAVSGFATNFQFGIDTRANELAMLEHVSRDVGKAVKRLSAIDSGSASVLAAWAAAHQQQGAAASSVYASACKAANIPDAQCNASAAEAVARASCKLLRISPCVDFFEYKEVAKQYWKANCLAASVAADHLDACAIAGPMRGLLIGENDAFKLELIFGDRDLIEQVWRAYRYIDLADAKACDKSDDEPSEAVAASCILGHATAIADAIGNFELTAPLARRDLLMFAMQEGSAYALLLSGAFSIDRASVYQDDIASAPTSSTSYDLQLGIDFTLYTPHKGLSLNARVGMERSRTIGAVPFQRCEGTPSTDATVSGSLCDPNALFRSGPQPSASTSGYVRLAFDYQFAKPYTKTVDKNAIVPGIEGRWNFENIGSGMTLLLRAALFATPVAGPTAARIGIALDAQHPLDSVPAGSPAWVITPLVFIGATYSDLLGN